MGRKRAFKAANELNNLSKNNIEPLWINIGIAGHKNLKIGNIYEIKKVIREREEKISLYTNTISNFFEVHKACTVDKTEELFKDNYIYDMESFGFLSSVELFSLREHIFIFKIISDNLKNKSLDYKSFSYNYVKKYIRVINKFLNNYYKIICIKKENNFEEILSLVTTKFHVTFYNKKKLERVLPKLLAIRNENSIKIEIFKSKDLKLLLNNFEKTLRNYILKI